MAGIELTTNAEGLIKRIDSFKRGIAKESHRAFERMGKTWVLNLQAQLRANRTPGGFRKAEGQPTGDKTGELGRSLTSKVTGKVNTLEGKTLELSTLPGVRARASKQEFGGVIRAKRAKYLTIPLKEAYREGGQAPHAGDPAFRGSFVANWNNKLFIVRPSGATRRGTTNNRFQFLFVLKKSVTLKKRLGGRDMLKEVIRRDQTKELGKAVVDAGIKAFGSRFSQ